MKRATLVCDETGNFGDDADRAADPVSIVGGVVVPSYGQAELDSRWASAFEMLTKEHRVRPHASEIRGANAAAIRAEFVAAAAERVREAAGWWLFVRAPAPSNEDSPFSLYVRTLEAWADLGARLAWGAGADAVDIVPAQRGAHFSTDQARALAAHEAGEITDVLSGRVRTIVRPGLRGVLAQLRAEGGPTCGDLRVDVATKAMAHSGVDLCDFGCSAIRILATGGTYAATGFPEKDADRVMAVSFESATRLRALSRESREADLDAVRLASRLAAFEAAARGSSGQALFDVGAARVARVFYAAALARWAGARTNDEAVKALVARLAGAAHGVLDAKRGAYEGLWRALSDAWAGDGSLAVRARSLLTNPEQRQHLWRLVLECANHRGDVAAAEAAWKGVVEESRRSASLAILAETLVATNIRVVALQNELPADDTRLLAHRRRLEDATDRLVALARTAAELPALAGDILLGESRTLSPANATEDALWRVLGRQRTPTPANLEVGRCLGTAARSRAFLGLHDEAIELQLEARSFFGDATADLRFNAIALVRILADRARVDPGETIAPALRVALAAAGAQELTDPASFTKGLETSPGQRFVLDATLRAMLWCRNAVDPAIAAAWQKVAQAGRNTPLLPLLRTKVVTHPSELIARHLGELATGDARRDWLDLSLFLSEGHAEGTTLRAFVTLTRGLREGSGASGAAGGASNPVFEYR